MASIDEVVGRLGQAGQRIAEAVQLLDQAENVVGQLQNQMAGAGVHDKAQQFATVRESIQRTRQYVANGQERVRESTGQAKAAGSG